MKHLVLTTAMAAVAGLFIVGQALGAGGGYGGGMSQPTSGAEMNQSTQHKTMVQQLNRDQIREMQKILNQKGFRVGTTDGVLGRHTTTALRRFQKSQGLAVTGKPDQETLRALAPSAQKQEFFGLSPAYHEMGQPKTQEQQMNQQQMNPKGSQ